MTRTMNAVLTLYGQTVRVIYEDLSSYDVKAFVQRLREKKTVPPEDELPLGRVNLRRWLYIGPKEYGLCEGMKVRVGGEELVVQDAAPVYLGAEKSHWWAVLRPMGEEL